MHFNPTNILKYMRKDKPMQYKPKTHNNIEEVKQKKKRKNYIFMYNK